MTNQQFYPLANQLLIDRGSICRLIKVEAIDQHLAF